MRCLVALVLAGLFSSACGARTPMVDWEPASGGGLAATGGTTGHAGATGAGGALVVGGAIGTGGPSPTGGQVRTGGVIGAGGLGRTGGVQSAGGSGGRGGSPGGAGGSGAVGGNRDVITFAEGRAQGLMSGYGWVALGALDTVTSPTCAGEPIASGVFCGADWVWSSRNALCVTGTVPALPRSPSVADYDANWGILVSAEATDPSGGAWGYSFQSVTFNLSGLPSSSLRAVVHRKGDAEGENYCATLSPGTAISFAAFNSACWDGSGMNLQAEDVPTLDWMGIQVVSGFSAVSIRNLCLTSILLK
jgi:hypothetical protein